MKREEAKEKDLESLIGVRIRGFSSGFSHEGDAVDPVLYLEDGRTLYFVEVGCGSVVIEIETP